MAYILRFGRQSPTSSAAGNDGSSSEAPVSSVSPPPTGPISLKSDETLPSLQLDDIQSAVPLDEVTVSDEITATVAFPHDLVPGSPQVPAVTITTSQSHISHLQHDSVTSLNHSTYPEFITSVVPFPQGQTLHPSPSGASSALSEGDKLTELPASFSIPRLYGFSRKVSDPTGLPTQDSFASSIAGHPKIRSGDSEYSLNVKSRNDVLPKRISFDNDRLSFSSSLHNVRNAFTATSHSLPLGKADDVLSSTNRKPSPPPIRSPSPLRNFIRHRMSREEPFAPVDPYRLDVYHPPRTLCHIASHVFRQAYRHFLLRIPSIYFTRVSRVFSDAELSRPEVQRMIEGRNQGEEFRWPPDHEWVAPNVSPAMIRFKESWETFVESVLKEWKTLNVVSALLLTAILAILQIEGISTALVMRTSASLSLICALMSLVYGCVYILRFGTMKSMYRAFKWAEEAQQATSIVWNVWVLLAMPAVWISWSMVFFCVAILDFVWDQPFSSPPPMNHVFMADISEASLSRKMLTKSVPREDFPALAPRILISFVFLLGLFYFILVVRTFRRWRDPGVSQDVRESMESGRWATRSPSPPSREANNSKLTRESRFNRKNTGEHKEGGVGENGKTEREKKSRRTRSADSAAV